MLKKYFSQWNYHSHKLVIAGISFFLLLVLFIIIYRMYEVRKLVHQTRRDALTVVRTITAKPEAGNECITLPGTVQAWHEAPIYARTNGYIKKWYADIGAHVKKGQLLAEIETPELNAQARQAAADLNTALANNKLAQSTAKRWTSLLKSNSVSRQETDEKISAAQALKATVVAAKANLDRLRELVSFEKVTAPFDGVITARATDIGALINSGSNTAANPLFRIEQTNPLRIYVRIPQSISSRLQKNMSVNLYFLEHPQHQFKAKLLDTAQAIDPVTRTLLAQFVINNTNELLLPGSYTEVRFALPYSSQTIKLPVNTLLFQSQGLQVAVVRNQRQIILNSVVVNRDFGAEVEIVSGVKPGDQVVLNPPDSISNEQPVRVVK